jgi:hypothetical protein
LIPFFPLNVRENVVKSPRQNAWSTSVADCFVPKRFNQISCDTVRFSCTCLSIGEYSPIDSKKERLYYTLRFTY